MSVTFSEGDVENIHGEVSLLCALEQRLRGEQGLHMREHPCEHLPVLGREVGFPFLAPCSALSLEAGTMQMLTDGGKEKLLPSP